MAGWSLDSPSHWSAPTLLISTSSVTFGSIVERAKYDAQSGQIPLWDGLNLQALVLVATIDQLSPLSLLLCFVVLCVESSSQGLLFHYFVSRLSLCLTFLSLFNYLYSWLLAICPHACSVPLPPLSIHLMQLHLEFPIRRQHECSRSGHMSPSEHC